MAILRYPVIHNNLYLRVLRGCRRLANKRRATDLRVHHIFVVESGRIFSSPSQGCHGFSEEAIGMRSLWGPALVTPSCECHTRREARPVALPMPGRLMQFSWRNNRQRSQDDVGLIALQHRKPAEEAGHVHINLGASLSSCILASLPLRRIADLSSAVSYRHTADCEMFSEGLWYIGSHV